jgi:hypothetical protein
MDGGGFRRSQPPQPRAGVAICFGLANVGLREIMRSRISDLGKLIAFVALDRAFLSGRGVQCHSREELITMAAEGLSTPQAEIAIALDALLEHRPIANAKDELGSG